MELTAHYKLKTRSINFTASELANLLRIAISRCNSSISWALSCRWGGPSELAHRDESTRDGCGPGVSASNLEAAAIMRDALRRGANQLELARAAVAAVQAILPLVEDSKCEVSAVIQAAETWVLNPNDKNAHAVWLAEQALKVHHGRNLTSSVIATNQDWARMAVEAAAMACCAPFGATMLAVLAVQSAAHAAGGGIDLAPRVTAALL
jgi:hypothetical protein